MHELERVQATKKPWGYEYLLFRNEAVAIWHLFVDGFKETSLHSHPNKKTGLVVLDGAARVSFLSDHQKLFAGEKTMIRHGVFHKTKSMTREGTQLLEIETPVDKTDIVRLEDSYGRAGTTDMGERGDLIKPIDIFNSTIYGSCCLYYSSLEEQLESCKLGNWDHIMITSGSLNSMGFSVSGPGDIISIKNLLMLSCKFESAEDIHGIFIKGIEL